MMLAKTHYSLSHSEVERILVKYWPKTNTIQGCLEFVDALRDSQQHHETRGRTEIAETIHFCRSLAFTKWEIINSGN